MTVNLQNINSYKQNRSTLADINYNEAPGKLIDLQGEIGKELRDFMRPFKDIEHAHEIQITHMEQAPDNPDIVRIFLTALDKDKQVLAQRNLYHRRSDLHLIDIIP